MNPVCTICKVVPSPALQDAVEYFQHLLDVVNRTEHGAALRLGGTGIPPTAAAFTYLVSLNKYDYAWNAQQNVRKRKVCIVSSCACLCVPFANIVEDLHALALLVTKPLFPSVC